ncbi:MULTISPECIES: STAS domain-containing protein [Amycolatopsis]|uniref:Anti-sigma factor antagonist n=1 Tax=Amycolatopsis thermalba TaxID=944492 RepID=A0ABY4NVX8_9PSEU|nr:MULTISPECIES: STAS domain-containing protein [Amycolatopsis]UQS24224.1 STAS domain-containing protein [Amycolatopsis thermalba]
MAPPETRPAPVTQRGIPAPRSTPAADAGAFTVDVAQPARHTLLVTVGGDVDLGTAPELSRVIGHRFRGPVTLLVLDLSEVTFLGTAGLTVLVETQQAAARRGAALRITGTGARPVERALRAAGMLHSLPAADEPAEDIVLRHVTEQHVGRAPW